MSSERVGLLAALGSATLFGTGGVAIKLAFQAGADTLTLVSGRALVAWILLWAALLVLRQSPSLPRPDLLRSLMLGVFYAFPSLAFFLALERIPASLVAVLLYTFPAWTVLLARVLYGESISGLRLASLGMTFLGIAFVVRLYDWDPRATDPVGVSWALAMALGIALLTVLLQPLTRRRPTLTVNAWVFLATAAVLVSFHPPLAVLEFSPPALALLGYMALLGSVLPMLLWLTGVRHLGASRVGIVATIEPVVTMIVAFLLLGERLEPLQLLGVAAVLAGIGVLQTERPVIMDTG